MVCRPHLGNGQFVFIPINRKLDRCDNRDERTRPVRCGSNSRCSRKFGINVTILNDETISIVCKLISKFTLARDQSGREFFDLHFTAPGTFWCSERTRKRLMLSSKYFPAEPFTTLWQAGGEQLNFINLKTMSSISTTQLTYQNNLIISNYTAKFNLAPMQTIFSNPNNIYNQCNFNIKNYSTGSETFYLGTRRHQTTSSI